MSSKQIFKFDKKAFCLGVLCGKSIRKSKCLKCKVFLCRICKKKFRGKWYCPDCYLEVILK